jgi:hypothetical protein
MPTLSKSKIIAFRQCPKRLWLELHHPELREVSAASEARFQVGYQVGDLAIKLYDPKKAGVIINIKEGFKEAFEISARLFEEGKKIIFEAGFRHSNTIALADVMIPSMKKGRRTWKMVEIKSSASVKDYHREDIAVQSFLARGMGLDVTAVALAHVDTSWTYPGGEDYRGFLKEEDLTEDSLELANDVSGWLKNAHKVASSASEPAIETGDQCHSPFDCPFLDYCNRGKVVSQYPVDWLPRLSPTQREKLGSSGIDDLRHVPDALLNPKQKRVRDHTIQNTVYFDQEGAAQALKGSGFPAYFLDFETANMTVPVWAGTRPYQQIPFQFSLHKVSKDLSMQHDGFLDLSGEDPSRKFAEAVIEKCGKRGPIYSYNASFEKGILRALSIRFGDLSSPLDKIIDRVLDLLPVAEKHFYHPSQQGSWSIKKVLPAVVPELSYEELDGVKDGNMAIEAFTEAIAPGTSLERKEEIRTQLTEYCKLDTLAMVGIWKRFLGLSKPEIA